MNPSKPHRPWFSPRSGAVAAASAVLLAAARGVAQTPVIAGPLMNPANGHSYYLLAEDDWQRSESTAVTLGGHLVTVNDAAEQAWVFETFGSFGGVRRSLWIGLADDGYEGEFRWVNGEGPGFTHWLPGQPDNSPSSGGEHFVHLINTGNEYGHPGGWWNDIASPNTVFTTFDPICGVVEVEPPAAPVVRIRPGGGGGAPVTLSWPTRIGARYAVEASTTLVPGDWTRVGEPHQGDGGDAEWNPPGGAGRNRGEHLLPGSPALTRARPGGSGPPPVRPCGMGSRYASRFRRVHPSESLASGANKGPRATVAGRSTRLARLDRVWIRSRRMELRHLRDFVAVAEEQNITRAATRLHVSQPPLSRQVRDLEQELGVALLERGAKSVRLTAAGRLFLDEARAVLRRADEAVRSVQALGGAAEAGTARGIRPDPDRGNPGPASAGLRGVVAGRLRASPRHDGNGDDGGPQGGGARGGAGRPAAPHGPGRARVPRVRQYRMGVLVARDHPLCRRRKLPVSAVRQEPLVVYRRADYPDYHETLEAALGTAPETWRIVEECDGALSLLSAVEVGRGIAVVPEPASIVAGQRAVFIPFTPSPALLEVGVCTRSDAPADARSLLEAARAVAG